jgi:hypothetical protein
LAEVHIKILGDRTNHKAKGIIKNKYYKFILYLPFSNRETYYVLTKKMYQLPTKREIYYMQYNYVLIYIIYGDRTIIGFVGFVVNLLNRPTDGTTVQRLKKCVRKRITFRPLLRTPKNIISNLAPFPGRF